MRYEWWQIALGLAVFALIGLASCAHGNPRRIIAVEDADGLETCFEVGDREPPRRVDDEDCWEWLESEDG
jgi:hypothetical protein